MSAFAPVAVDRVELIMWFEGCQSACDLLSASRRLELCYFKHCSDGLLWLCIHASIMQKSTTRVAHKILLELEMPQLLLKHITTQDVTEISAKTN